MLCLIALDPSQGCSLSLIRKLLRQALSLLHVFVISLLFLGLLSWLDILWLCNNLPLNVKVQPSYSSSNKSPLKGSLLLLLLLQENLLPRLVQIDEVRVKASTGRSDLRHLVFCKHELMRGTGFVHIFVDESIAL